MNREIKFRGKRLDNGKWVFGDLLTKHPHHKGLTIVESGVIHHEVDPETVGQYTGLKDTNDAEIYEGDIMVFRTGTKGAVVHSGQGFVWRGYPQDPHNPMGYFSGMWQSDFEVIGNIHDNPELLEV